MQRRSISFLFATLLLFLSLSLLLSDFPVVSASSESCLSDTSMAESPSKKAKLEMKAVVLSEFGGPEKMSVGVVERPTPAADEVLVRVHYTAINRADCLQRKGGYAPPPGASSILGLEFSGEVVELGAQVNPAIIPVGLKVCGLLSGGGYAEYVTVHANIVIAVPEGLSLEMAAALPEAFMTAYQALFWIGGLSTIKELNADQKVLIHAGASGVGVAAIQLCKLAGVEACYATAGSAEKLATCKSLGATDAFNYKESNFAENVLAATGQKGVDILLDFVGQSYWDKNLQSLAVEGKMVMLGFLSGAVLPEGASIAPILRKRLTITGSTLRARDNEYKSALSKDMFEFIREALAKEQVQIIVDKVFTLEDIAKAHEYMEANLNKGKIVIKVSA